MLNNSTLSILITLGGILASLAVNYGFTQAQLVSKKEKIAAIEVRLAALDARITSFTVVNERVAKLETEIGNVKDILTEIRDDLRDVLKQPRR